MSPWLVAVLAFIGGVLATLAGIWAYLLWLGREHW